MTADEARECVERIKRGVHEIRQELRGLYRGKGWAALGYASWRECAVAEFGKSQRRVYQELAAAEVEEQICTNVQTGTIPESHLRPLTTLKPEAQPVAWQRAVETLPEGERMTAAHVSRVVRAMTEGEADAFAGQDDFFNEPVRDIANDTRFACEDCGDTFDMAVWHCAWCDSHWPLNEGQCSDCFRGRDEVPEDEDETLIDDVQPQSVPPFALMSSERKEWYTPAAYVDAAREVMGGIDLDPASSAIANQVVKASAYYAADNDGMAVEWHGRVWLNPPYGSEDGEAESNQARWSRRLIDEYRSGRVTEAVLLVNATPSNAWWAPLWDFPICFTNRRIRFFLPSGEQAKQPTHSNALVYLGPNVDEFDRVFTRLGVVAVRRTEWGRRDA